MNIFFELFHARTRKVSKYVNEALYYKRNEFPGAFRWATASNVVKQTLIAPGFCAHIRMLSVKAPIMFNFCDPVF